LFYLAVVLEKRNILDRGFDAQDVAELVVHFDGCHSHGVPHARALDAYVLAVAHLILVVAVVFLAWKCGDVVWFDRVVRIRFP